MSMESWLQKEEREEQIKRKEQAKRAVMDHWWEFNNFQQKANHDQPEPTAITQETTCPEYTGGSVSYYKVRIDDPLSGSDAYVAECNDIIEALGMNYAEGNAFKAIWRMCAARTLGKQKKGYTDGLYDAEKVAFFGARMVEQQWRAQK